MQTESKKLGAFLGVFTPTILTILGVIMYLRFGWVLGQVGIYKTLIIVVLANCITMITSFSLSSIATNSRVGVGGAYYMISRSLGLELGGAIGIPLFASQVLSITLYAYGLAEATRYVWPQAPVQTIAVLAVILVAFVALRGALVALKSQLPIMALIGVSLAALVVGAALNAQVVDVASQAPAQAVGFWQVFAVFFPAVTGIMAGLSMSGDLREPKTDIPRGTIRASAVAFCIYLMVPVVLWFSTPVDSLLNDPLVWTATAFGGSFLVMPALLGAIFSSAVGSALAAPRTLNALVSDGLAPRWLASAGKTNEPRRGVVMATILALAACLLGDLNTVATVVTMVFLSVYGMLNLVSALESLSGNPSWRPKVKVPWGFSLSAAVSCVAVMVLISPLGALVAVILELILWGVLARREREADWGDVRRDLYEQLVKFALIRLSDRPMTARNWRPHITAFTRDVAEQSDFVRFALWFSGGRGVVTACELKTGKVADLAVESEARESFLKGALREKGFVVFPRVSVVDTVENGIVSVAQNSGMAGMESNLAMLGWPETPDRLASMFKMVPRLNALRQSLVIGRAANVSPYRSGASRVIHVWWGGLQRHGDLMLLLAYLITRNPEWRGAKVSVIGIASSDLMRAETERYLDRLISEIRIEADVQMIPKQEGKSVREMTLETSRHADLVLLPFPSIKEGEEGTVAQRMFEMSEGLSGSCYYVNNASLFIGGLVTPDGDAPSRVVPIPVESSEASSEDEEEVNS